MHESESIQKNKKFQTTSENRLWEHERPSQSSQSVQITSNDKFETPRHLQYMLSSCLQCNRTQLGKPDTSRHDMAVIVQCGLHALSGKTCLILSTRDMQSCQSVHDTSMLLA